MPTERVSRLRLWIERGPEWPPRPKIEVSNGQRYACIEADLDCTCYVLTEHGQQRIWDLFSAARLPDMRELVGNIARPLEVRGIWISKADIATVEAELRRLLQDHKCIHIDPALEAIPRDGARGAA